MFTFSFLVAAVITGFFATVLMTITVMVIRTVTHVHMSMPLMLGSMMAPHSPDAWKRRIGMMMHLGIGSFYGFVFGLLIQKEIFFDLTILSGVIFALILWMIMMVMVLPMRGMGFFGFARDKRISVAALIGHLVYGISFVVLLPLIFLN